jgi:phospho-N-acetylmuramoyl-pentapeptide-transferase
VKTILIATGFALLASILCTPLVVVYFRRRGFGQEIRSDGPQSHLIKRGTPTMGGVAIIASTVVGYAVAHVIIAIRGGGGPNASGVLLLFLMVGLGTVGFVDDFIKIRKQRSLGLRARAKFLGQLLVGVVFAILALQFRSSRRLLPGEKHITHVTPASEHISFVRDIGVLGIGAVGFVIVAYLIISATSNAVNLTDGLDGLAAGASAMVFGAFTLISFLQYRYTCGDTGAGANCYVVRDPLDVALVAASAMAACFGFLWWNAPPAQIFMGDTGSMALGGLMAGLAIMTRTELLLVVLGGLFAMVTLSGIIQTGWFKFTRIRTGTGRRVFRMAPLHHHFELAGWEPTTVIVRFWILGGIAVALGMGLFYADFLGSGG